MKAYEFNVTASQGTLPQDNGYLLLSALSLKFPFLHGRADLQVAPLRGTRTQDNRVALDQHSVLHIRGLEKNEAILMGDSWIMVENMVLGLGRAKVRNLNPSPYLASRLVVLADHVKEEEFRKALTSTLGENVKVTLGKRRGIALKGRTFLGYSVHLQGLDAETSTRIQKDGIGKFTSMGCGVFYPGRMRPPQ